MHLFYIFLLFHVHASRGINKVFLILIPGDTHRLSGQTGETTLSTLSGETHNTALSSNTLGSGETRSTLHRTTQSAAVHNDDHKESRTSTTAAVTHRGSIRAGRSLLSTGSSGSNGTDLTGATGGTGLTTGSSCSIFADGSGGSRGASGSLWTDRGVSDGDTQTD